MHRPRHEIRVGIPAWMRCDHDRTAVDLDTGTVRLAPVESVDSGEPRPELRIPWQLRQGGVLVALCEGSCDPEHVWYLPPEGPAQRVAGTPDEAEGVPSPGEFTALPTSTPGRLQLLVRGARGLGWAVYDAGGARVVVVIDPPSGRIRARWTLDGALAAVGTLAGAVAASEAGWWRLVEDGRWLPLSIEADASRVIAMAASGSRAFALLREAGASGPELVVIDAGSSTVFPIPGLENPLHLVAEPPSATGPGAVWISEIEAPPPARTLFERFEITADAMIRSRSAIARDFDGRGAWWSARGHVRTTRPGGEGPLMASRVPLAPSGIVELPAFDSARLQTTWHRVFVDVCLPPGTRVRVSARAADALPASPRSPALPPGTGALGAFDDDRPLGSRSRADVEGWRPQPDPTVEPHLVDRPLAAERVRPSLDTIPRGSPRPRPDGMVTLELLLDADPGRYLWLRLHLEGTGRLGPAVHAVRVTHTRPSLLDHLPAWWRLDATAAAEMDRVLALFEGDYTERQALIDALPRMLDPRTTPAEALDWLSGFLAIERDEALDEAQRRQLLLDMPELYRRRGTVWAMERLAHIVTGAPARVVEHFRLRGRRAAVLDGSRRLGASVIGETLHLGAPDPEGPGAFESAIVAARPALEERRAARDCPPRLPPLPVATPAARWARTTAHHFTVVVFRGCEEGVRDLLDRAIEAAKPAHTIHHLCWADSGLRLDVNARVGLGTQLSANPRPPADLVGAAVLQRSTP